MAREVTIKDLANQLQLSTSTISRALKDHYSIGEETKKAVRALADELGYKPNQNAISLIQGKNKTIGVLLPEITTSFFSYVIAGIEEVAINSGYQVLFTQSGESIEKEKKAVETLLKARVDGFILAISKETKSFAHLHSIVSKGKPLVLADRGIEGFPAETIKVDDLQGTELATDYLVEKGCRRIAYLSGFSNLLNEEHRKTGYLRSLKKNNLSADFLCICEDAYRPGKLLEFFKKLKSAEKTPDGVVSYNDYVAFEAIKACKELKIRIPEDISIFGFADEPVCIFSTPTISTVKQPAYELGKRSAEQLLQKLQHPNAPYEQITLSTNLIIRESTR